MYICVAKCVSEQRLYISLLTNDLALQAHRYLQEDKPPHVLAFEDVPTMSIHETSFFTFEDLHWVKSYIRLSKEHNQWDWNTNPSMLPPIYSNTKREQLMIFSTKPIYRCIGFNRSYTPILTLHSRDMSNSKNYRLSTTLMQMSGFPAHLLTTAKFQPITRFDRSLMPYAPMTSNADNTYVEMTPPKTDDTDDITHVLVKTPPPQCKTPPTKSSASPTPTTPDSPVKYYPFTSRATPNVPRARSRYSQRAECVVKNLSRELAHPNEYVETFTIEVKTRDNDKEKEEEGEEDKPRDHR